jgi:glucose-1-phosphate thymidylyltransferase
MKKRKGIILAGGNGTRLYPLTYAVSKQMLPVYDKPMIYYPISTLQSFGINDILIIAKSMSDMKMYQKMVAPIESKFSFAIQKKASGIPDAFNIGHKFIGDDDVTLILGDNIFDGIFPPYDNKVTIYGVKTSTPELYGVIDSRKDKVNIVEKPTEHISDYAVPGLYHFDNSVTEKSLKLEKSKRGELEIVDVINQYIQEDNMSVEYCPDDMAWFDCGNHEHLLEAGNYVRAIQNRTSRIVGGVKYGR